MADHTLPPTAADEQNSSSPIAEPKSSISSSAPLAPTDPPAEPKKPKLIKSGKPTTTEPTRDEQILAIAESFNRQYAFVRDIACIASVPTPECPHVRVYSPATWANSLVANYRVESVAVGQWWLRWKRRREVERIDYIPGRPSFADNALNSWLPSPVKPIRGDITPWTRYLDHVFKSDPTYRDWFTAWLAYPLQHPGTKLHTACVFWSTATATGKSTLGYIMSHLYGVHNFIEIGEADLHTQFNFWAVGKQFVMGEEIKGQNSRKSADYIKAIITRRRVIVNLKNVGQYTIPDNINYYFTSNHPEAFYLEQSDRRFFVHELGPDRFHPSYVRNEFIPWLESGGYSAILYHLTHDVDLSRPIVGGNPTSPTPAPFLPHAAAPQSRARQAMIETSRDDLDEWIDELVEWPINVLDGNQWTLATAQELYDLYVASKRGPVPGQKAFSTRLRKRLHCVYSGHQVELSTGKRVRLYELSGTHVSAQDALRDCYESEREYS